MKIFSTSKIQILDNYTIENEPIRSIDLMERAAEKLVEKYLQIFHSKHSICIFVGPGNNGGDALAMARMLLNKGFEVTVILLQPANISSDCNMNLQLLVDNYPACIVDLKSQFVVPTIADDTIIIDGVFGSGLKRPLDGIFADAVNWINNTGCTIVSIDIPSGLMGENNLNFTTPIIKATYTFTLQFPKLSFFFPENNSYLGKWEVLDIGIHPDGIKNTESNFYFLEQSDIQLKNRSKFSHKGSFGHAYIIAGSTGMAGASVLSAKAALRSGAGLVTVHGAKANREIVQTAIPEVIYESDFFNDIISEVDNLENKTIAVGPGIGTKKATAKMLENLLGKVYHPCIIDADALNIISQHKEFLKLIPKNSIITPHPKEFERLFGSTNTTYERMEMARKYAVSLQIIIILKVAHTMIITPEGNVYFNSTGNSGMATAGSGDVLTGILVGLLAQGYDPIQTALIGVYMHGLAADLALNIQSQESLIASDIIQQLGASFKLIHSTSIPINVK